MMITNSELYYNQNLQSMTKQGNLQPTSTFALILLICLGLLAIEIRAFTFSAAVISLSNSQINAVSTYTISLMRSFDNTLNPTNWNSTAVPANATSTVIFPSDFQTSQLSGFSCDSVMVNLVNVIGYSCILSSNTIIVSNLFSGSDMVSEVDITLSNIVNPSSALTTNPFIGTIGSDTSSSSASAQVAFSANSLSSLAISFAGKIVNRTSDMILNLVIADAVPADGLITVQFPATLIWTRQLSSNHLIPFNGTLSCYGITSEVNNSTINCQGSYSTKLVTISNFLTSKLVAGNTIEIGIQGLFAPPTTQPIDSLTVSTCDSNGNLINTQSSTISGLVAQTLSSYSMQTSLNTAMGVNNFVGGLTFSFTLTDTISFRDYFLITFPSGTTITFVQSTSTIKLLSTTYTSSNFSLVMLQNTSNANSNSGTAVTITFIRFRAPPSTAPSGTITFTILNSGYAKMSGSSTITAVANNYTLAVTATSSTVNVYSNYTFTFTMSDALTSSGYFVLILDPLLSTSASQKTSITSNLSISISGTSIRSSPSTQISTTTVNGSSTYQLLLSNLNTSSANIPTQSVTIKVNNLLNPSSAQTLTSFTVSTYYSSSADLVANARFTGSITMQAGSITLNSISSTATTTYTFTTISVAFTITNQIPASGFIILTIPSDITLLTASKSVIFVSSSLVNSTYTNYVSNNTIILQISSSVAAASTVTISVNNIMTQNTTKTTASFSVKTYDASFLSIDQSSNSLGLSIGSGNNFNSLSLTRESSLNSFATNYTIVFQQIQAYTSVSVVSFIFKSLLSLSSLSRVYEVVGNSTIACLFTVVNSTYLQVTLSQSSTSSHTIIIQKVINPPSEAPLASPILVITSTSNFSYVYSQMYTGDIVNTDPSSLTVNSYAFSSYIYAESTNLALSLTTLSTWPTLTYQLIVNIPSGFDITSASCSSSITNLGCSFFNPTNTLTVSMTDSSSLPLNIIFSINSLTAPPLGSSISTFVLTTFDSSGYRIQSDTSTVIFQNNCSLTCRTCSNSNSSICLSCYSNLTTNLTLLYNQSCVSACPSATYQLNLSCLDCSTQCLTCIYASNNCSTCNNATSNQYFYFNTTAALGSCFNSCSSGTYNINLSCYDCPSICKSCNSSTYCFSCQSGYFYFNGSCLSVCPNNTLTNSTNSSCTQCQSPCSSCINTTSTCLTCIAGTILFNNTCSSSCPLPNLYISTNQTCESCDSLCATCFFSAANCTSCNSSSNNSHLFNNTCLSSCPGYYYSNSTTSICELCSNLGIGCVNCSSSTTCLSCDSGFLYFPQNQTCLNYTPNGYYSDNSTIYPCNATCRSCFNLGSNCTSCSGNLSLYQNSCVPTCPLNLTVSVNNICQFCTYPCSTCVNSTTLCLSCSLNSSLYYDSSTFSCVNSTSCPNSTFSDNSSYICTKCNSSCVLCSGTSTNCSQCASSYYLISDSNLCSQNCPNGTIKSNQSQGGICQSCAYPCLTCSGTINFCLSCSQTNGSLFLSSNGSCVANTSCQAGTYANNSDFVCQPCPSACLLCSTLTNCSSCQANYSLITSNNTCSTTCPTGYAPATINGSSVCSLCVFPCSTCSKNINNCTSCASNSSLYLQGNQCVNASSCPSGTYANSTSNVCQTCVSSCTSCVALTNCTNCSVGYYYDRTTFSCLTSSQCPNGTVSGYNSTSGRNQCLTCSSPCLTCSVNTTVCTSCLQSNSSAFLLNNSCVNASACPDGTFADVLTYTCMACVSPCAKCANYSICITCVQDYFLNGTQCLGLCPNGTYVLNQSGIITCVDCNSSCATCSSGSHNCTSCSNSTYLFNHTCVNSTSCPLGTYANNNTNSCINCSSPCSTCQNSTFCLSCNNNSSIDVGSGICYSACLNGTISINVNGTLTCLACSSSCLTCQSSINNCSSCSNSSLYLYNGSCYDPLSCPNGTFPNSTNSICQACSSPCQSCSNSTICLTCISGYYLLNNTCLSSCPNGTTGVNSTGSCDSCQYPCLTCIYSVNNCTSCLVSNSTQLYYYNGTCYNSSNCPQYTYQNNQSLVCSKCVSPCLQCLSASLCTSCVAGFYYNQNYSCIATCPNGTVAQNSSSGGICQQCLYPCTSCSGSPSFCLTCSQSNSTLYLYNGTCISNSSCANGTYANQSTLTCQTCQSSCSSCQSFKICLTCNSGYYFNNNTCISICPNGTVAQNSTSGGVCQGCIYPCIQCSGSPSNCSSCSQANSTLYLSNGSCVSNSSCQNGTYANSTLMACVSCVTACTSCTNYSYCLTCSNGYYLYGSSCLSACPNTTVADNTSQSCVNCSSPCKNCVTNQTTCTSCLSPFLYYSLNNSCLSVCPDFYYANSSSMLCILCVSPCSTCQSNVVCKSCLSGFYFFSNGSCLSNCPNGYYNNNVSSVCSLCQNNCSTCSSQTSCKSCSAPYLLYNNTCGVSCPSQASYNVSNVCKNCTQAITGCLLCNSSNLNIPMCVNCSSTYVLSNGVCIIPSSGTDEVLSKSLKTSSIFPLPFTITGGIIFIACFMSKLQNKNSYVVGTAYSLFGFIQSACLIYTIIIYNIYISTNSAVLDYQIYLQAALLVIVALNIFGAFVQTYQLYKDEKFTKWTRSTCNYCCYVVVAILSCLFNYKLKMLIFTKLFSFNCLRAQLQSVQKFRVFNVMSFLGVGHQGLVIYISAIILASLPPKQQTFLSFLDLVLVNVLNIGLALAVSSKEDTFFEEVEEDGIKINKIYNAYDQYEGHPNSVGDQKKGKLKDKGLESRDILMDEDDEFTLSISDRDSSNVNDQTHGKVAPSSIHRNKSAIIESESSQHQETGISLKRGKNKEPSLHINSNNFSAVYEGDLSKEKRKQFQQSHHLSKEIADKSIQENGQNLEQSANNKVEKKEKNIFDVGGQFYEEEPINNLIVESKPNQNEFAQIKAVNADDQIFNEFQQGQTLGKPIIASEVVAQKQKGQMQRSSNNQNNEASLNQLNPSSSQANMIPPTAFQREIKVYKGKQVEKNEPQDIEQIDLTISKKQRQLIELRKSIRKKQRQREMSQERKSRKNRSSSKDRHSKEALSQLGLVHPKIKETAASKISGQHPGTTLKIVQQMIDSKLEVDEQLIAPVSMSPQIRKNKVNQSIKQEIILSNAENTRVENNLENKQNLQSSIILDEAQNQQEKRQQSLGSIPNQSIEISNKFTAQQLKKSPIKQSIDNFSANNLEKIDEAKLKNERIAQENSSKAPQEAFPRQGIKVDFQKFDKQLDNKYDISPRDEYDIEEMDYEFKETPSQEIRKEQNIFQYRKQENSFISQEPSEVDKRKLVGFISKPHKQISAQFDNYDNFNQKALEFNVAPDSENNPLENKVKKLGKNSMFGGNNSFHENDDALDEMMDKTSRNQVSKNRSHLIKNQKIEERQKNLGRKNSHNQEVRVIPTQESRLYQDFHETSTVRQGSEKEFTERKMMMNRPPMQHQRPATTEKNRIYIAGLKQLHGQQLVNTLRTSLDNSSLKNQPNPPKTSYNMDFRGVRSKEFQQEGDGRFDMHPSSLSSNQIRLGSQEFSQQPSKPIISRGARIRQIQVEKDQQNMLSDSFARKSMKSYKSRSIDRNEYEHQNLENSRKKSINREENQNDDLNQYYKRNKESPSSRSKKSKSRSRSKSREGDRRITELEKIYLQRLQYKK